MFPAQSVLLQIRRFDQSVLPFPLQAFIRRCLAYHKEDRVDVLQLASDPFLMPHIRKALGNSAPLAPVLPSTSSCYSSTSIWIMSGTGRKRQWRRNPHGGIPLLMKIPILFWLREQNGLHRLPECELKPKGGANLAGCEQCTYPRASPLWKQGPFSGCGL